MQEKKINVLAFNGSFRKEGNTVSLLNSTLEGAQKNGVSTELIHLYDLNYKGCISCFACKLKEGKSYGQCSVKDDLAPVLKKIEQADALIFGTPIYFGNISGMMHSFLERLFFPYIEYKENYPSIFNRKIQTAFIYSMNLNEEGMRNSGYEHGLKHLEFYASHIFGACQSVTSNDTFQFNDYSKYESSLFDPLEKERIRKEIFPQDCMKAYNMGKSIASKHQLAI